MPRTLRHALSTALFAVLAASACTAAATDGRSSGAPAPAPSSATAPAPSAPPKPIDGGTVTLTDGGCSWDAAPEAAAAPVDVELRNDTDDFGVFIVHRLKQEFTWADGEAAIAAIQAALAAGRDWPNWSTNLSIVEREGTAKAGAAGNVVVPGVAGTYGIVCSANEGPTGDILSVFLVGPLEVD